MTNLDSILKNRDIALPTKVCLAKAMVFSNKSSSHQVAKVAKVLESQLQHQSFQ